ncbi:hypothetical protein CJ030_MR6G005344 [Morella rubra]|uniref:Uncharacterized protein n=1 Tax=Morella rubra TaxID=262757 RepID=A0A6A1VAA2_9ROSI|nr:hypothetical protein CJ030_MR6G005344 [Morella rubra]
MVGYSLDLEGRYIQEGRLRRLASWMLITYQLEKLAMVKGLGYIQTEHAIDEADLVKDDISEGVGHGVGVEGLGEGVSGEGVHGEGFSEGLGGGVGGDDNDIEEEREKGSNYGMDLSDFPKVHDDKPNAYEEVGNEKDASGDTARNVDWLGAFPSISGGREDGGVMLEYEEAEDFRSCGGSDSDDGPRVRDYPKFTQNLDQSGEVTLEN